MRYLIIFFLLTAVSFSNLSMFHKKQINTYLPFIDSVCRVHNVNPTLVLAIITIESGWNPLAKSLHDCRGLMQVLKGPYSPKKSIISGIKMLSAISYKLPKDRLHLVKTLESYNRGVYGATKVKYHKLNPYSKKVLDKHSQIVKYLHSYKQIGGFMIYKSLEFRELVSPLILPYFAKLSKFEERDFKLSQISKCRSCPRYLDYKKPIAPQVFYPNIKYFFVGKDPSADDVKEGSLFTPNSITTKELKNYLSILKINSSESYLTNMAFCSGREFRQVLSEEAARCSYFKMLELSTFVRLGGSDVFLMGLDACRYIIDRNVTPAKNTGFVCRFSYKHLEKYIPEIDVSKNLYFHILNHPAYLFQRPELKPSIYALLEEMSDFIRLSEASRNEYFDGGSNV